MHLLSGPRLRSFVAGVSINTDDRPLVEFNAPRNLYRETTLENLLAVANHINGHPAIMPVTGMARAVPGSLSVAAMHLDINFPDPDKDTRVQAQWLVWREPLKQDGQDYFGIGSSRQLQWQTRDTISQLQATWIEREPGMATINALLDATLSLPTRRNGDISMHGGYSGRWMLATDKNRMQLGIIWTCPDPTGGLLRYTAVDRSENPGESA